MYLVNLQSTIEQSDSLEDLLETADRAWEQIYDTMAASETLWIVAPNRYEEGKCWPVAMALADRIREETPFVLKNTITVHNWRESDSDLKSAYDEILFLVKNKREYTFNKDEIRISHVYEGNEWGGEREKGNSSYHDTEVRRYNPDGKDPGNVWMTEFRDGTPNQEIDETDSIQFNEAIRRCVLAGSNDQEVIHTHGMADMHETIRNEGREVEEVNLLSNQFSEVA